MIYLWIVSFIWAFSFGLIKGNLTGLDSNLVSLIRMMISLFVFLPFFKKTTVKISIRFFLIGMVQFGLMYLSYIYSFQFLKAYQVALFTIFTPVYVILISDILDKKWHSINAIKAIVAVVGTSIIVFQKGDYSQILLGFAIVQISNISFATGQVLYKQEMQKNPKMKDRNIMPLLYTGAVVITFTFSIFTVDFTSISLIPKQIITLLYLGTISSGVCFFLWNYGAKLTKISSLSVMNNLKIPLAVLLSLLFWKEQTDLLHLSIGTSIILFALLLPETRKKI